MMWNVGTLASGSLGTSQGVLFKPSFPTVVRGVRVSNTSGVSVTCTLYLTTLGGSSPISTPGVTLTANESFLLDTPIMLSDPDDSIQGVGSQATGINFVIWGVVKQ